MFHRTESGKEYAVGLEVPLISLSASGDPGRPAMLVPPG